MVLNARLPLHCALAVCALNVSLSVRGAERTVAYAFAVCFFPNVALRVCGVACAFASAFVACSLKLPLNVRGAARAVAICHCTATAPSCPVSVIMV